MVTTLRRLASRALALLVCASVLGASFEAFHHAIDDDIACLAAVIEHDAADHRIDAATSSPAHAPDHCFFCHWARTFRLTQSPAKRLIARQAESTVRLVHAAVTLAAAPDLSELPARAPPQFS